MPGRYTFEVGGGGWDSFQYEDLDELADGLEDEVASVQKRLRLRLVRPPRHPLTLPAVLGRIVNALEGIDRSLDVALVVASEEVEDQLIRVLPAAQRPRFQTSIGPVTVHIVLDDIAAVSADAIVNASNTRLKLGAGVSGAIAQAATGDLQAAMFRLAPIPEGAVAVTGPHGLSCQALMHAATASGDPKAVATAVAQVLETCAVRGFARVSLPALGTGVGGLSPTACATIFAECLGSVTESSSVRAVTIVLWSGDDHRAFVDVFARYAPA